MGILDRIFNRGESATKEPPEAEETSNRECLHVSLMPYWDEPGDMGDESKASRFECASCGSTFTPAEAEHLRATEAQRVRHQEAT